VEDLRQEIGDHLGERRGQVGDHLSRLGIASQGDSEEAPGGGDVPSSSRTFWGSFRCRTIAVTSASDLLRAQWERSCERLLDRLDGLTDDEYRWEPVARCWNVRPSAQSPSGWTVDYPDVHPNPPPVTTIAWRMLHISDGNSIYWEHSFGPGVRNFWDLAPRGDAAGAIEYLTQSQRPVTATLAQMDDQQFDDMRPTHFGVAWPAHRVLAVLIDEQVHHGAEIALLRDLYRNRETNDPRGA
jgi:hypothetical protein